MKKYFIDGKMHGMYQFLPAGIEADYKAQIIAASRNDYPLEGNLTLHRAEYNKRQVLSVYDTEEEAIVAAFNGENELVSFKEIGRYAKEDVLYREYYAYGTMYPRFGLLLKNEWDFNVVPYCMGNTGYVPCPEWEYAWGCGSCGRIPHEEGMENRMIQVYID